MGTNFLKPLTLGRILVITLMGLLVVSIASNNFLITSIQGQTEISEDAGSSHTTMREVSLNNDICDIDSESPFSPNALLERLRDEFCHTDRDLTENEDEIDDQFIEAEIDEDDQGNDEDEQGNDEDEQGNDEDEQGNDEDEQGNDEDDQGGDEDDQGDRIQQKLQEMKNRLEMVLSEEEEEDQPLSGEEQNEVEEQDQSAIKEHKSENDKDCRGGNVVEGASNEEDLKVLTECQEAAGEVVHTKKMDDGDYKFLLNVEDKYKYLLNEKNNDKTDGYLVVEIVPPDQGKSGVFLPKEGDHVHIWGAWVTDKPKGWHEIHPAWKVINQ
jgi:hypothetical protein